MQEVFESSEPLEQRAILGFLLQNPTIRGKKLDYTLRKPFDTVLELAKNPTGLCIIKIVRTYFAAFGGGGQKSEKSACTEELK